MRSSNTGPRIDTPWGAYRPTVSFNHTFDLGTIRISIDNVVDEICEFASGLQEVTSAADTLVDALVACLAEELKLNGKEVEKENAEANERESRRRVGETRAPDKTVQMIEPGAAAAYTGNVPIEIALTGISESFLGSEEEDGEIQRIFVFLNHVEMDINLFTVSHTVTTEPPTAVGRLDAGLLAAQHPLVTQVIARVDGNPVVATSHTSSVVTKATHGKMSVVAKRRKTTPSRSKQLGQKPGSSAKKAARSTIKTGITLKAHLEKRDVLDGFNTLTVVVSIGDSEARLTETVVFVAADPPKTKGTTTFRESSTKLATEIGIDPNLLHATLRQGFVTKPSAKKGTRKKTSTLRIAQTPSQRTEVARSNRALVKRLNKKVNEVAKVRADVEARKIGRSL